MFMTKKYCDQCGQELNISAQFCSACGASVPSVEKETVGNKVDKIIDKTKSGAGDSSNVKFILIGIIAVLAVLILVFAFSAGLIASDAVDVTSVSLDHKYFYANVVSSGTVDERPITGIIKFSFMPKEYLERVTGIGLKNIEITYSDGQTQKVGSGVFNGHENIYNPHQEYSYSMNYVVKLYTKADDNIDAYYKTNHVKADIVVNTTSETNKVIGHINQDVVPPSK